MTVAQPSWSTTGQTAVRPRLGLVCITTTQDIRFRTITRKRLLSLELPQQQASLQDIYQHNLQRLADALEFCHQRGIGLYRIIDKLFPFADEPVGAALLEQFRPELQAIGDRAAELQIRLVQHPSQYVVLSSDKPDVVRNSIKILQTHAWIFDLLGLPQSPWAAINIHGGKGDRADQLVQVIRSLPTPVRSRLTLENDEYTYGVRDLLPICDRAAVPLVFDAHHHLVHDQLASYDKASVTQMTALAQATWPQPDWQLTHISNGREFLHDPRHSDLIHTMPQSYHQVPWIEVEAKHKEQAIAQLQRDWLVPCQDQNCA